MSDRGHGCMGWIPQQDILAPFFLHGSTYKLNSKKIKFVKKLLNGV